MEALVALIGFFSLVSLLVLLVLHRKHRYWLKVKFAKEHGVELIAGPVDFYGEPEVLRELSGLRKNLVNVKNDIYIFEYHYWVGRDVGRVVDMMVDLSCRTGVDKTFFNERLFLPFGIFNKIKDRGYRSTISNVTVLNFLADRGLSVFYGNWGLIVAPNSGRIRDIEGFVAEVDAVKKIFGL